MTTLLLCYAPVTCARVSLVALEEIGAPYDLRVINVARDEQLSAEYLGFNPKGKVPVLVADGRTLTETPAILTWLAKTYPEAGLLPLGRDDFEDALVQSDLNFASSGLHPIVTRLCRSQFFSNIPGGPESVYAMSEPAMHLNFRLIEERLSRNRWWYGDQWSMMDVYLNWIWYRVTSTPFDVSPYGHYAAHGRELSGRPAMQRAERRGEEAMEIMTAA